MKTKLVKVPENEAYYFCKRVFFEKFGDVGCCFANCLIQSGWTVFPFVKDQTADEELLYTNSDYELPNLLLFANTEHGLDQAYNRPSNTSNYNLKIIITDIDNDLEVDEIIDISNLQDYYQTELSLDKFINELLEYDLLKENTTSQKD